MFQDVLFPEGTTLGLETPSDVLTLRRLKRFIPERRHPLATAPLVIFDLETTGLDPEADRIIEIGAIKTIGNQQIAQFSSLVSTSIELTDEIIRLTKITPEMLKDQPRIDEVIPQFLDFIDGAILVAHNAEFDLSMLKAACSRLGIDLEWPCFCTLKMARELLPDLENRKLDTLAEYYGLKFEARHRSIGDVKVTAGVLSGLFAREAKNRQVWAEIEPFAVS